jgi:hypothetical protein
LQPDEGKDEMQHCHKSTREFLIARRQSSKLLEAVKKALNQIPVFVNMVIVFSRNDTVSSARNAASAFWEVMLMTTRRNHIEVVPDVWVGSRRS